MWLRELTHLFQRDFPLDEDGCRVVLLLESTVAAAFHLGGTVLGEPRFAPSTLDHLTAPLTTCVSLSVGAQTQTAAYTHRLRHIHTAKLTETVTPVFSLFCSIYHSVAESATIVCAAACIWTLVIRPPVCPRTHFLGRLCVCLCVRSTISHTGWWGQTIGLWMGQRCNRSCCTGQDRKAESETE